MRKLTFCASSAAVVLLLWAATSPPSSPVTRVIVQGSDLTAAATAVAEVGGQITHRLGIIDAVGADLTPPQVGALAERPEVRVYPNRHRDDRQLVRSRALHRPTHPWSGRSSSTPRASTATG